MKKKVLQLMLAVGLIGLVLAFTPRAGEANPPPPENPAGPKQDAGNPERYDPGLRPLTVGQTGVMPQSGVTESAEDQGTGRAWAPLTYESYRDGNWEIYTAAGDGTNPVRLTNHPATDVQPRMRRGGGRIVFASDRSGNAEIYSMAQDGSDVCQLTFDPGVDRNPNWSPDGAKIAFESNRDGQYEVYVMNADGSQVARLTNDAGFDGQPTWSPDQARIAFTAYRNNQWRIWTMNPDGSGLTQLSQLAYSENPVYSPDGKWVAFDSDGNLDSKMEICVMPVGGGACSFSYSLWGQADALMRGFSPDSCSIAFTRANWIYSSGGFEYTQSYLSVVFVESSTPRYVETMGLDWNPDWQTLDLLPPQSRVDPLPLFSRAGSFQVAWSGADSGPAGIKNYDIQGKVGVNGTVNSIWMEKTQTNGNYIGRAGDTVYFRSRARDWANNLEAWPAGWDTFTCFYKWLMEGTITDIRGIPLEGVALTQSIPAFEDQVTRPDGTYTRHLAGDGTLSVIIPAPAGYGQLPPALPGFTADQRLDFALPPADNLIHNPWFDDEGIASWLLGGGLAARADSSRAHSGAGSALLASWLAVEPVRVADNANYFKGDTKLERSVDGTLYLFWSRYSNYAYSKRSPAGTWSTAEIVADGNSVNAHVAPDGTVHVFYLSGGKLYYKLRKPEEIWSVPEDVTNRFNDILSINFALDSQGKLHAVWEQDGFLFYLSRTAAGVWGSAQQVRSNALLPIISVLPDDSLYVSWVQWLNPNYASYGMKQSLDGVWGSVEVLPGLCDYYPERQLEVNPAAGLAFSYICRNSVQMTTRSEAGTWSQLEVMPVELNYASYFRFGFGADGSLHVVWCAYDLRFGYRVRYPDGDWSAAWYRNNGWDSPFPVLEADNDMADLVWFERTGASSDDEWAARIRIPRNAESTMTQRAHIPAGMNQPTLSFAYLAGSGGYDQAEFAAEVNGLEVFSASEFSSEWKYASADLSAYAGQDVTLTFHATSGGGAVPLRVNIDEVSIGSWRTPVVTGAEPQRWEAGLVTVHGENFIATPQVYLGETLLGNVTWVDANTLTAEVPAGIPPGRQRVRVVNPDGPGSSQPVTIAFGEETFLPGVWR
jgi:hypothetical protein